MQRRTLLGLALASAMVPAAALAQTYPSGTVAVVVPFSAGGSNDTIARYMADGLSAKLGVPFVVENRPGGGTAVGAAHVATAKPDGQTILFVSGSYTINAATRSDLPFDPVKDLRAVGLVALGDIGVISGPKTGIKTFEDLIREAKARKVFYATAGVGSQQHFFAAMLADVLGIEMTPVPYPGGAEGLVDLLGGRIDIVVGTMSGMLTTIENGANPVAVLSEARLPGMPDLPTATDLGYPAATTLTYWTVFVPDGTPAEVMAKLHDSITEVFASPKGTEFLASLNARPPAGMSIEDSQAYIEKELAYWTKLSKDMGLSASK